MSTKNAGWGADLPPDQKRALGDYRCACRKIARLLQAKHDPHGAAQVIADMEELTCKVRAAATLVGAPKAPKGWTEVTS
jgi:hypothetical protein